MHSVMICCRSLSDKLKFIFLIFSSLLAFYYPFFWGVILLDVISKNKEMRDNCVWIIFVSGVRVFGRKNRWIH